MRGIDLQRLSRLGQEDSSGLTDSMFLLDEQDAINQVLDWLNRRKLLHQLWLFAAVASLYLVFCLLESLYWQAAVALLLIIANLVLLRIRKRDLIAENIRMVISITLVGHLMLLQVFHLNEAPDFWFILFLVMTARFRFSTGELLALTGAILAVLVARTMIDSLVIKESPPVRNLLIFLVAGFLPCFTLGWWLTQRRVRRFMARWRTESGRHRDRLRMKRELESARQIQLSMLPRQAPDVGWLEIAALSLPATEVGGDYYDYFQLDLDRLAVVVGDVTGHGVASGLVLSGVRSSLNLLQEELAQPRRILGRLNRMLKKTTTRHMLMTLGLVVLDREQQAVTMATAGHPPMLVMRRRSGSVSEIGHGSFPLGALKQSEYQEERVDLERGDVILVYSDGLVETTNNQEEQYGWERLHNALASQVLAGSAREIRDAILRDVWSHKAETEQVDDVTMVVIRVKDD
jgi:sigma-B regulation protein RsbU (phosphoserine phosphatase)